MSEKHESNRAETLEEFDPTDFEGVWWHRTGTTDFGERAHIRKIEEKSNAEESWFGLYSSDSDDDLVQELIYVPATRTLEDDSCDTTVPDRCISFWNRQVRDENNRIFAMRMGKPDQTFDSIRQHLLSWETGDEEETDGAWGAEDEPPSPLA